MTSQSSPRRSFGGIEPLESRIAPARVIVVGATNSPNPDPAFDRDTDYIDANNNLFVNTETANFSSDLIAATLGRGEVGVNDVFYLRLFQGDELRIATTTGTASYLKVTSGELVAVFVDGFLSGTRNNEVDQGELVSLALGNNTAFQLNGSLAGDIVANLNTHGTSNRSDDSLDTTLPAFQSIRGIRVGDSIFGNIFASGNIANVSTEQGINSIFAGSAADGQTFDFLPGVTGGDGTLDVILTAGKAGPSISNVSVNSIGFGAASGTIAAGDGGAGAAGGSINRVIVREDLNGFTLRAGDGGAFEGRRTSGGAGGSISNVFLAGAADPTTNDLVQLIAGDGGDGLARGGKGGGVSTVFLGYDVIGGRTFASANSPTDNVRIEAGAGGDGKTGGIGGSITRINALLATPDTVVDELAIIAGAGGVSDAARGRGGAGGSISAVVAINSASSVDPSIVLQTDVLLQAGDGGLGSVTSRGGAGGSISTASVLSGDVRVFAGDGGDGSVGGTGGLLRTISVEQVEGAVVGTAIFSAGNGGDGLAGNGGTGGGATGVFIDNGDLSQLEINAGAGGDSTGGRGGIGGSVRTVDVQDVDLFSGNSVGTFFIRGGQGGDGTRGGAAGGSISSVLAIVENLSADFRGGDGGDMTSAVGSGNGGAGGLVQAVQVLSEGLIAPNVGTFAVVAGGAGGDGGGTRGSGGRGALVQRINLDVEGSVSVFGGNGGNGTAGASGAGGSIIATAATGRTGSGELIAGDAGAIGGSRGVGGNIQGGSSANLTGVYAATSITVEAGDGANGGAGGTIRFLGYGSAEIDVAPTGNIQIEAGQGSVLNRTAGAGGSLQNIFGTVSSGDGTLTQILAGNGAGGDARSSGGGSISNLNLQNGGSLGVDANNDGVFEVNPAEVRIRAGDAGDGGASVRTGANGGSINGITIGGLEQPTLLRSIAAGDGGGASARGGVGGSIANVFVLDHDIGIRQGQTFGYERMGGLFAGAAGAGAGATAKAGSVSGVTAMAIASIVAGRADAPELVEKVSKIILASSTDSVLNPESPLLKLEDGDLTPDGGNPNFSAYDAAAYATGYLVGAVVDPTRLDANMFFINPANDTNGNNQFDLGEVPTDGLIAAKVLDQKTINFTPEARLIGTTFFDYDNFNNRITVAP